MSDPRARYDHVQRGGTTVVALGSGVLLCCVAGTVAFAAGRPADRVPVAIVCGSVLAILVTCLVVFRRLRVVVTDAEIVVSFGSGRPRRRIALADVCAVRAVRNAWWCGWGIRLTPHGWLWNVDGLDAVEVELAGGKRFRIGTDDPAGLVAAIESARG